MEITMKDEKLREDEAEFLKEFTKASSETLSTLSDTEKTEYEAWAREQSLNTLEEEKVYDMPGYWKDQVKLGETKGAMQESTSALSESVATPTESEGTVDEAQTKLRPHFPDTFKRETHPTFSSDSQYHDPEAGRQGGQWEKDEQGKWHFHAGPTNLEQHGVQGLKSYFETEEKDSVLHLPEQPEAGAGKRFEDFFKGA
jgi:hypothetical protein